MVSPRRAPDERKRQAILTAAMNLFLKNGFAKTSMNSIAAAADVTKQTVYAHFKNKDSLFEQIINQLAIKHAPPTDLLHNKNTHVEYRLYEIGLAFLNMVSSKEGIAATQLVIAEAYRHQKLAQHYYESGSRKILEMLGDYLKAENKRGTFHIPVPLSAASYFFAMLKGNYYIRILLNTKPRPSPGEKEAHVRECVTIFMRLYGGDNALRTKNIL
jgi:TetR/AcrR family transcriptional regulator, mexJK operon transcriptional repressor